MSKNKTNKSNPREWKEYPHKIELHCYCNGNRLKDSMMNEQQLKGKKEKDKQEVIHGELKKQNNGNKHSTSPNSRTTKPTLHSLITTADLYSINTRTSSQSYTTSRQPPNRSYTNSTHNHSHSDKTREIHFSNR